MFSILGDRWVPARPYSWASVHDRPVFVLKRLKMKSIRLKIWFRLSDQMLSQPEIHFRKPPCSVEGWTSTPSVTGGTSAESEASWSKKEEERKKRWRWAWAMLRLPPDPISYNGCSMRIRRIRSIQEENAFTTGFLWLSVRFLLSSAGCATSSHRHHALTSSYAGSVYRAEGLWIALNIRFYKCWKKGWI